VMKEKAVIVKIVQLSRMVVKMEAIAYIFQVQGKENVLQIAQ